MSRFTELEAEILNHLQKSFPIDPSPFLRLGERLNLSEERVIEVIRKLKEDNVVRNIAGIFDGKTLGYHLSLVALEVPEDRIEHAAETINAHPGVSHNYLRDHRYNIWFTLAEETPDDFEKSVSTIARRAGAKDMLVLRNEKLYKIGFTLAIGNSEKKDNKEDNGGEVRATQPLDDSLRSSIFALQRDLPLETRPFDTLAREAGIESGEKLLEAAEKLMQAGYMRRYAAVLRHRQAGYTSNAMTAWRVPDADVPDELIQPFAEEKAITHLYLRTLYPGRWEHRLFAMIHAKSDDELVEILNRLESTSGLTDHLVLRSLREFKKQKVMYFSPEFSAWKEKNYD